MNKTKVILFLPYASLSGYGIRSYDLLRSIIQLKENDWNYKIVSLRFGSSPQRELDMTDSINQKIVANTITQEQALQQPVWDISIFCTVGDGVSKVKIAKYSILFTAGIESTLCSSNFLLGCNNMDLTICSSTHSMNVIKNSVYDQKDQNHNIIGQLKLDKPITTLFEGTNILLYDRKNTQTFPIDIPESFCYLINGQWLPGAFTGGYSHDRKHLGTSIKTFLETFKSVKNKPALVIKTNSGNYSHLDESYCRDRIDEIRKTVEGDDLPNIYLIHGELSDNEMVGLYQNDKIKAMISVSNEGWGRSFPEYLCATSKPIITIPYGGVTDYIKPEYTLTVGGTLQPIHKSAANQFLLESAQIYYPDIKQFSSAMMNMFTNYSDWEEKAKRQAHYIRTTFTTDKMTEALDEILNKYVPIFPKVVQIKLPNLSAMNLPKLKKID